MMNNNEFEMRKRLVAELKGLLNNLKYNTDEYRMTQKVLQEIKRTRTELIPFLCTYAEFFEAVGIFVRDVFEDII